jgi:hypothetical protein
MNPWGDSEVETIRAGGAAGSERGIGHSLTTRGIAQEIDHDRKVGEALQLRKSTDFTVWNSVVAFQSNERGFLGILVN